MLAAAAPTRAWHQDWAQGADQSDLAKDARWAVTGVYRVVKTRTLGKLVVDPVEGAAASAYYRRRLFSGDQSLSVTVSLSPEQSEKAVALFLCADMASLSGLRPYNGYAFLFRAKDGASILKFTAGVPRVLAPSRPSTLTHWKKFILNAAKTGEHLTLNLDGQVVAEAHDSSFESGYLGFGTNSGGKGGAAISALDHRASLAMDAQAPRFQPSKLVPILGPTLPWEDNAVFEPNPIKWGTGFLMSYTGGGEFPAIGLARSMDGIQWKKVGSKPVVGAGTAGEKGPASRSNLIAWAKDEYRLYYSDGRGDIRLARSSDGSQFLRSDRVVIAADAVPGVDAWANQGYLREGPSTWALVEGRYKSGLRWQLNLFRSDDNGASFQFISGPLSSLQAGLGVYCSPRAFFKVGASYHLWYHVSETPDSTAIWHATSKDLIHWVPDVFHSLGIAGSELGLAHPDQVADPVILERGHETLLYYDTVDNSHAAARIGVAAYSGSLAELIQAYPQWKHSP
jgi:hypothetical protein